MRLRYRIALAVVTGAVLASMGLAADLKGTVHDSTGVGVSRAVVTLQAFESKHVVANTQTDASGAYVFAAIPGGSYTLQVNARGFATSRIAGIRVADGDRKAVPAVPVFSGFGCGPFDAGNLWVLDDGEAGGISGTVLDRDRKPMWNAKVSLVCRGQRSCAAGTTTDRDGHYWFTGVEPGAYLIMIEGQGYFDEEDEAHVWAGLETMHHPIQLYECESERCGPRQKVDPGCA
jgi:protocatechuate 3,4-dioxygenase beta subunit